MPNQKRRSNGPVRKSAKKRTTRRRTPNKSLRSQVILTMRTKTTHLKQEVYPISFSKLISRFNVGSDVDITCSGYTLSVTIATGNDPSTVTANIGHSGPWVRRGDNQLDTFNQQCAEHNFSRSKTIVFKVNLAASERQFFNPDVDANYVNLRITDMCGVIPGATLKLEARAILHRKIASTAFPEKDEPATDRYEDQDVSTGVSSGVPQPPAAIQDVPVLVNNPSKRAYITTDKASPFTYTNSNYSDNYVITAAGTINIVGEFTVKNNSTVQTEYSARGYQGTIVHNNR